MKSSALETRKLPGSCLGHNYGGTNCCLLNHPQLFPLFLPITTTTTHEISSLPHSLHHLSFFPLTVQMKLQMKAIHPKNLFRSKKTLISKSEPSFYIGSTTASSCSSPSSDGDRRKHASTTPTSVLIPQPTGRSLSTEISSGEWSDTSGASASGGETIFIELVEALKLIDHDGDGKVTRREMETLLTRISSGGKEEETQIATMLAEIDEDGDGCISIEELSDAIEAAFGTVTGMDELREAFDVFDADHDGKISAEELMRVFIAIGDERYTIEECKRMIQNVDANGDGFVCFEDFSRMMDQQQLQLQR